VLGLTVEALLAAGARRAEPGEFTARAFLAGRMDVAQVHGVAAMIAATSDRTLQAAERLLHGALARTATAAREELADLLSLVEGALDFADEPIEFITPAALRERITAVVESLERAAEAGLRAERWGRLPQVLLTGPPNAGKSSLLNRLSGVDRAICAPMAGTTRDVLSAPLQLDDGECLLLDVAGLDDAGSGVAGLAQAAARSAAGDADLLLIVVDVSDIAGSEIAKIETMTTGKERPRIVVGNKLDLLSPDEMDRARSMLGEQTSAPVCLVSAATGAGCDELVALIEAELHDRETDLSDGTIALMAEHRTALDNAVAAARRALAPAELSDESLSHGDLVAAELREAAEQLGMLVGRDMPDDLLGRIFSRFCIGK